MKPEQPADREKCRLEYLVEPFEEGNPGPHVLGTLDILQRHGLEMTMGPFGNTVDGDYETLTSVLPTVLRSAFEKGASRISITLTKSPADPSVGPFSEAVGPAPSDDPVSDEPAVWNQAMIGLARPEDIHGAVERIVAVVETRMGGKLGDLPREKKQAAVRILDEQGVFLIRKSVETVAEAMGVSRITIYNYLNAIRGD
ncbi:MAG: helix-turn-helix domain-containing protein [bacterium]|nr:helix-turn-helix domain-containing protein [bacterium]MDE0600865.1 helix-turn-helix domain-containing protein [bacterium]